MKITGIRYSQKKLYGKQYATGVSFIYKKNRYGVCYIFGTEKLKGKELFKARKEVFNILMGKLKFQGIL